MTERIYFDEQISRNKWKTFFLMAVIFLFLIALIYVIGSVWGKLDIFTIMIFAIIISLSYLLISYYNSDKIALASAGAKEAKREDYRQYYNIVEGLTLASGLPMPKLYIMNSEQINAFASGRSPSHAVICITKGALNKLDKNELEGVIAHELGHIASYDIRYMTLVAVMVGMISIISQIFLRSLWFGGGNRNNNEKNAGAVLAVLGVVLAIVAPIAVYFVQLAISRKREYSADASSVKFTRFPKGLINALKKIEKENQPEKKINKAIAPLFIADPFEQLESTHPSIKKRIELLERM